MSLEMCDSLTKLSLTATVKARSEVQCTLFSCLVIHGPTGADWMSPKAFATGPTQPVLL